MYNFIFQVLYRGELTEEPVAEAKAASPEEKSNESENIAEKYLVLGHPTRASFFEIGRNYLLRRIRRWKNRGGF